MVLKRSAALVLAISILLAGASALAATGAINGVFEGYPIVRVMVNGSVVSGDVPAINFNGRTMVPVRFVSEALGAVVGWNADTWTASIDQASNTALLARIAELEAQVAALSGTTTPTLPPTTTGFAAGTYLVNSDMQPGRYRSPGGIDYWERLSGLTGNFSDILANGAMQEGPVVVDIKPTDVAFKFRGTGRFVKVGSDYQGAMLTAFGDGMYIVGKDIVPGLYRSTNGADYWARLSGFSGSFSEILANDAMAEGSVIVEIKASDVGFETRGAEWVKIP